MRAGLLETLQRAPALEQVYRPGRTRRRSMSCWQSGILGGDTRVLLAQRRYRIFERDL